MQLTGVCQVCGRKPTVRSCIMCGRPCCSRCLDGRGVCMACRGGRMREVNEENQGFQGLK